jgi:uncharacterized protein YpuA (DUF1002 family)
MPEGARMNDIRYVKTQLQKVSDNWNHSAPNDKTAGILAAMEVLTSIVEAMARREQQREGL